MEKVPKLALCPKGLKHKGNPKLWLWTINKLYIIFVFVFCFFNFLFLYFICTSFQEVHLKHIYFYWTSRIWSINIKYIKSILPTQVFGPWYIRQDFFKKHTQFAGLDCMLFFKIQSFILIKPPYLKMFILWKKSEKWTE